MSWRPNLIQIFDILLRVPPLFAMDAILNRTILIPWIPANYLSFWGLTFFAWIVIISACFILAMIMFLLPTKQLIEVYAFGLSGAVLWFSFWFNENYINTVLEQSTTDPPKDVLAIITANPQQLFVNVIIQLAMAFSYNSFRIDLPWSVGNASMRKFLEKIQVGTYMCFLQPTIWRLMALPFDILQNLPLLIVGIVGSELMLTLMMQVRPTLLWFRTVYVSSRQVLRTYGIQQFVESQWLRLHVPNVLRVFWLTRIAYQLTYLTAYKILENSEVPEMTMLSIEDLQDIIRYVLISGCETLIALLGMTSVVSYITHYVGIVMAGFVGSDNEEDRNMGTVSAMLFFILALQTGLTRLDPDKRMVRLYRNFCLLSTAILHFVHSMVNPLLLNLSAARNPSWMRHARPLIMCFFLITFPCWFLHYLWTKHTISTWLLAVTAFSIEVVIKVIISLLVYALFMIDAYRDTFWEKLDDYVYYIKSTGNTIEFLFGIFLFCNGAWIMFFEAGGTIRAFMMCIHAYFNIWVQAKEGWKVFMKRRTAVNKINGLPEASTEQLSAHNDVCAICYQELLTARVTRCNHLFHGVCLRKWLYVQDRCPLCHENIYPPDVTAEPNGNIPQGAAVPQPNGNVHHHQE